MVYLFPAFQKLMKDFFLKLSKNPSLSSLEFDTLCATRSPKPNTSKGHPSEFKKTVGRKSLDNYPKSMDHTIQSSIFLLLCRPVQLI